MRFGRGVEIVQFKRDVFGQDLHRARGFGRHRCRGNRVLIGDLGALSVDGKLIAARLAGEPATVQFGVDILQVFRGAQHVVLEGRQDAFKVAGFDALDMHVGGKHRRQSLGCAVSDKDRCV